MEPKVLYVMRGIPGSGKTKTSHRLACNVNHRNTDMRICSADSFFMKGGEYVYNPSKAAEAHASCREQTLLALLRGEQYIIVDNTNIHRWEYISYVLAGKLAGYEVVVYEMRPRTRWEAEDCASRCTHNVPVEIVLRMHEEFEPVTDEAIKEYDLLVRVRDTHKPTWHLTD